MPVFLTAATFYALAVGMGFTSNQASKLTCIAKYESAFNRYAQSPNHYRPVDHGILQINNVWLENDCKGINPYEPGQALHCAKIIIEKQGFKAWVAYNRNKKECSK